MMKKLLEQTFVNRLVMQYQHGMLSAMGLVKAFTENYYNGMLTYAEANYLIENIGKLKKVRLH